MIETRKRLNQSVMLSNQRLTRSLAQKIRDMTSSSTDPNETSENDITINADVHQEMNRQQRIVEKTAEMTDGLEPFVVERGGRVVEHRMLIGGIGQTTRRSTRDGAQTSEVEAGQGLVPRGRSSLQRGGTRVTTKRRIDLQDEFDTPVFEGGESDGLSRASRTGLSSVLEGGESEALDRASRAGEEKETRRTECSEEESAIPKRARTEDVPRASMPDAFQLCMMQMQQQNDLISKLITERREPAPHVHTMRGESVPEYDPSTRRMTTKQWIHCLEQFKEIFRWSETTVIYHMQSRLRGVAREWYDNLREYRKSWEEWKEMLTVTFPEPRDHASALERMKARTKMYNESYEAYYFAKVALLRLCQLTPWQEVDHILDGITDRVVRYTAKANGYETPEELYQRCLLRFAPEDSSRTEKPNMKCRNCGKIGHIARNCRQQHSLSKNDFEKKSSFPTKEQKNVKLEGKRENIHSDPRHQTSEKKPKKCENCGAIGHVTEKCWQKQKQAFRKPESTCFNCKERGHRVTDCPKKKIQCTKCKWYGHEADACPGQKVKLIHTKKPDWLH